MALSIGIVGLPNVGKSSLFNALTENNILSANYPFATIEPNTGIVPIPDARLDKLAELYSTEKKVPATVTFVDIAGLVKGAAEGQGLGNQFLSHIREVDAICHVVRAFEGDVVHVEDSVHPERDIEIINTELVLADLQTVQKRLPVLEKEARSNPKLNRDLMHLKDIHSVLNDDTPLHQTDLPKPETLDGLSREYQLFIRQLITSKPVLYVFNVGEQDLADTANKKLLTDIVAPAQSVFIAAEFEAQLNTLTPEERKEMLAMHEIEEPGLYKLIEAAQSTLGLQSFLTAGPKEVRAWTIPVGTKAPQAAGVIHTDFERGFIAAAVVKYDDLIEIGSLVKARASGKVRTEGKDYIMQENDVVEFRFNV